MRRATVGANAITWNLVHPNDGARMCSEPRCFYCVMVGEKNKFETWRTVSGTTSILILHMQVVRFCWNTLHGITDSRTVPRSHNIARVKKKDQSKHGLHQPMMVQSDACCRTISRVLVVALSLSRRASLSLSLARAFDASVRWRP